ncbi:MAG: sugar transferase [Solirubrobacterales bacterium]|nr:sugar transferase [Solirubrobacterales bacterium]
MSIDILGVYLAVFSAIAAKALVRDNFAFLQVGHATWRYAPFAALVTVLLFAAKGLYGRREIRPGFSQILAGLFQATVIALIFGLVSRQDFGSYYIFYGSLFFAAVYVGGLRQGYEAITFRILRFFGYRRRVLLVGSGSHIGKVASVLHQSSAAYETVGFISPDPLPENGLRSLGNLDDLPDQIEEHDVVEVILADPDFPQDRAVELIDFCHQNGVTVRVAPTAMEVLAQRAEFVPGEGVPLFELRPPVFEALDYAVKRSFDLVVAAILLVVLSPFLLVIAVLVKLTSRGPVLHRGVRPGIGERPFQCLKFRTMYEGAENEQSELEDLNEKSGALFKIRDDPRMTPVGNFLRAFSIDELPQLLNVLRGQMSLVGPRPLPLRDYQRLDEWHRRRYLVLPGITGLWQVSGRANLDFDDLVRLDFLYIESWSVFLDVALLVKTIPAVLRRRGAY